MFKRKQKPEPAYESEYLYKSEDDGLTDFRKLRNRIILLAIILCCVVSGFLMALHYYPK